MEEKNLIKNFHIIFIFHFYYSLQESNCKFCDRHQHPQPAIGIIECPGFQVLKSRIRILEDFPCVTMSFNACDSNYQVFLKMP